MSFFRQVYKGLLEKLFPQKDARPLNEQPTRPLDAEALAKALTGEGRRHVSTGSAKLIMPGTPVPTSSLYLLMARSDGLNALPDFGIIGIAECETTNDKKIHLSKVALSAFAYQLTQKAILDFLELEGFENLTPLQNIVIETMDIANQVVQEARPGTEYSLTAGLMLAEIMILGHRGNTRAYHIDRHHIERITPVDVNLGGSMLTSDTLEPQANTFDEVSSGNLQEVIVYSRPVPRDGYILLCTSGLWKKVSERDIQKIVMSKENPQEACQALITKIKDSDFHQELSVLLLYFPPDFGPWR